MDARKLRGPELSGSLFAVIAGPDSDGRQLYVNDMERLARNLNTPVVHYEIEPGFIHSPLLLGRTDNRLGFVVLVQAAASMVLTATEVKAILVYGAELHWFPRKSLWPFGLSAEVLAIMPIQVHQE